MSADLMSDTCTVEALAETQQNRASAEAWSAEDGKVGVPRYPSSQNPSRAILGDTYKTKQAEASDRAAVQSLAKRLRVPERWVKPDDCGAWCIEGPKGTIYPQSDRRRWLGGWLVHAMPGSGWGWSRIKKQLGGVIRQDGEDEGVILLAGESIVPSAVRAAIGARA